MKKLRLRPLLEILIGLALLAGLAFFCSEAQAISRDYMGGDYWGGGYMDGGYVGRGFLHGSYVGSGFPGGGLSSGVFVPLEVGRKSPTAKKKTVQREPGHYGGGHMVIAPGSWGPYYGPGSGAAATGAVTPLKTGMMVRALPSGALAQTVKSQRYFFDGYTYYRPCYQGAELAYCVVPDPNK